MAPLHYERPRGPRPQPRPQSPITQPSSTCRKPVALQQEPETKASMLSQNSHSDPIKLLQLDLHDAISIQSRLMDDIAELLSPAETSHAIESSLREECSTLKNSLAQAVANELSLQQEIQTLKASLARARCDHRTSLEERSAKPSHMHEIAALKKSLTLAADSETSLRREVETLKTTLTHALTSEREMRVSARQTREEWERVERSLREEINTLRYDIERMRKELKGKKMVPFIQRVLGAGLHEVDALGGSQQNAQAEGRRLLVAPSNVHLLFDGPALQPFEKGGSTSTMDLSPDTFGASLIPELAAVERAAEGLQRAANSELRRVYTRSPSDLPPSPLTNNAPMARNLRLLVVLWEAKSVDGLLNSLATKLEDSNPTKLTSAGDCPICTEHISPKDMTMVEGCGHVMCKGCLREYIGARLGERVWPILCPICMAESGPGRRAQSITRFLVDELDLSQYYLNQWIDFELSQFVVPATCPGCTKPNLFELSEYNRSKLLICMHACKCAWCRDCSRRVTVEAPHDCEDAALDELAGTRRWMRCPRPSCRVMVEKNAGCDHITCRCGMHFCYRCGEDITGKVGRHTCPRRS